MSWGSAEKVHDVLWDWAVLRLQEPFPRRTRQELARTMYRIGSTPDHARAMLRLAVAEADIDVVVSLTWGCFRTLSSMNRMLCHEAMLDMGIPQALGTRCPSLRLLLSDMVVRMLSRGLIPGRLLEEVDGAMIQMLDHTAFKRNETIDVVLRYLMFRLKEPGPLVVKATLPVNAFLPCGGLAWVKAIEYLAAVAPSVPDFRCVVPQRSEHGIYHLTATWHQDVCRTFVRLYAASDTTTLGGPDLAATFDVLTNCSTLARDELWRAVPGVLGTLESIGHAMSAEDRYRVWDQGWRVLECVPPSDLQAYVPRLLSLVERVPVAGLLSWSKTRIRSTLTNVDLARKLAYHDVDVMASPTVMEILPDDVVRRYMSDLVADLEAHSCYIYAGHKPYGFDLSCLRLLCRMTADDVARHHAFVVHHVAVLTQCIATWQPDPRLKVGARNMLGKLPDILVDGVMDTLVEIVEEGDGPGMLAMSSAMAPRQLRPLARSVIRRVFDQTDVYKVLDVEPSDVLLLLARLPEDILCPLVDQLVAGRAIQFEDMRLRSFDRKDRLYVLNHLPPHMVTPDHATALALATLGSPVEFPAVPAVPHNTGDDGDGVVTLLFMELMVRGQQRRVCELYASWIATMLTNGLTRSLRYEAHKMLLLLDADTVASVLVAVDVRRLYPRHACLVLSKLRGHLIEPFADAMLNMAESYPYLDAAFMLLGRLPSLTILRHKNRVLRLIEAKDGPRWDGTRYLLRTLAMQGSEEAYDMLLETRCKDVLS